ncbi:hypothetical protein TcBrA4_0132830 [Trypanosoma cruzi]|nr:hypothetical protein TcBrA4_0132830 [Trypanosoma cruzi]
MVRPVPALGLKAALSAGRRPRLLAALVLLRHRLVQARHHTTTRQRHILQSMPRSSSWRTGKRHRAGRQALRFFACWLAAFTDSSSSSAVRYSSTAAMYTAPTRRCAGILAAAAAASPHGPRGRSDRLRGAAAAVLLGRLLRCLLRGCHPCLRKTKNKPVIKCGWVPWLGFDLGKQREERRAGAGDLRPKQRKKRTGTPQCGQAPMPRRRRDLHDSGRRSSRKRKKTTTNQSYSIGLLWATVAQRRRPPRCI